MSTNPTHVSAATEPSSGVQGHVHFNIQCSISKWNSECFVTLIVECYQNAR
jgi:hypothetical protein